MSLVMLVTVWEREKRWGLHWLVHTVMAAHVLSLKLRIFYLDLCCLNA